VLNVSSFSSKKIHDGDCFASLIIPLFAKNSRLGYFFNANNLRRFSPSKFHFDFRRRLRDWDRVAWRRRFSQSKFHFDFEDDLPLGSRRLWLLIPFLAKNSRLGYFLNARNPNPVIR
jgi:hypothetical protein